MRYLVLILALFSCLCTPLSAVRKVDRFRDLAKLLEKATPDDLVVFDVDDILITTVDQFGHANTGDYIVGLALRSLAAVSTIEEKEALYERLSLLYLLPARKLVDEKGPLLVNCLQSRGVPVIALTRCTNGRFGLLPSVENWRKEQLLSLGFDFSSAFSHIPKTLFIQLAKHNLACPLWNEGILYSSSCSKGELLEAFISLLGTPPAKIFFVDDLRENVVSVEEAAARLGVPCESYLYTGVYKHYTPVFYEMIELQFMHLIENGEWICDEEARIILPPEDRYGS